MTNHIEITNLKFSYDIPVILEDINLEIAQKEFLGIVGPNGGGKTTLLKLMLGLLKPDEGTIKVLGKSPVEMRNKIGYVPQSSSMDNNFPLSVFEVVSQGLFTKKTYFPGFKKHVIIKINESLEKLNIRELANKPYGELSGGQKQRTLIARALVSDPEILFLDEPTSSVDSKVENEFYNLLNKLNENMTIVLVSHDVAFISSFVNKIACVNKKLVCHNSSEITGDTVLTDLYKTDISAIHHHCGI